jgi:CheY-like chemotaxis protein
MPGFMPGIHVFAPEKSWMAGTKARSRASYDALCPAMTGHMRLPWLPLGGISHGSIEFSHPANDLCGCTIWLSRDRASGATQPEPVMANVTNGSFGASVLIVEDQPSISGTLAAGLAEQGFAVNAASNGADALCRLQAGLPVDVMVTDIVLAGAMDGAVLARRARELRPDLPIIYTAQRRGAIGELDPVEGAMFVSKPCDLADLSQLLQYLIAARRTRAGAYA